MQCITAINNSIFIRNSIDETMNYRIDNAILQGDLDTVIRIHESGVSMTTIATSLSGRSGSIEMVKWLKKHGIYPDLNTLKSAAGSGYLELVKYLIADGVPANGDVIAVAAQNGHRDIISYLGETGVEIEDSSQDLISYVERGSLKYETMRTSEAAPARTMSIKEALRYHSSSEVKNLLTLHDTIPSGTYDEAANMGIEIVQMIHSRGGTFTDFAYFYAVKHDDIATVRFLDTIGVPLLGTNTEPYVVEYAVQFSTVEIVSFLHNLGVDIVKTIYDLPFSDQPTTINSRLSVVEYILNLGDVSQEMFNMAIESYNSEALRLILSRYPGQKFVIEEVDEIARSYNITRVLIEHDQLNLTTNQEMELAKLLIADNRIDIVKLLHEHGMNDILTPVLELARKKGRKNIVKLLGDTIEKRLECDIGFIASRM